MHFLPKIKFTMPFSHTAADTNGPCELMYSIQMVEHNSIQMVGHNSIQANGGTFLHRIILVKCFRIQWNIFST